MQSSSFMKTPFKELINEANMESHDVYPEKPNSTWATPKTLSSTLKKHPDCSYASPPPKRAQKEKSPPSEFNKKTNSHFRNGIIRSQQEFYELY